MRASSVMTPSRIGTLKSTRTKTVRPSRSQSAIPRIPESSMLALSVSDQPAKRSARSTMRFENPASLSYQLSTFTSSPFCTFVRSES